MYSTVSERAIFLRKGNDMVVMTTRPRAVVLVVALALAASLLTLALLANPTQAQAERNRFSFGGPFAFSTDHPCASGVIVTLEGELQGFSQTVETPNGQSVSTVHLQAHGTGVDSEGNKYVINETDLTHVVNDNEPPFTFIFTFGIISQGPTDNFMVTAVTHVSPNGEAVFQETNPICRG
jgi:hypothetical protein